jgi:hypothetical protein
MGSLARTIDSASHKQVLHNESAHDYNLHNKQTETTTNETGTSCPRQHSCKKRYCRAGIFALFCNASQDVARTHQRSEEIAPMKTQREGDSYHLEQKMASTAWCTGLRTFKTAEPAKSLLAG